MLRSVLFVSGFLAIMLSATSAAEAANDCQRSTGGKCKTGQTTAPNAKKSGAVTHKKAQPPARSNHKGRDAYTPEQREKMMELAREICRKNYGAPSRVYSIDYTRMRVLCTEPGY